MNVNSKMLKIHNLPKDGKKVGQVTAKPYLFITVCFCVGVCLLYTRCYLLGWIIIVLFGYNLVFVKDIVLAEFYEQYAVFYVNHKKDECYILFWGDIEHWSIKKQRHTFDTIDVLLKNQKNVSFKCFHKRKIEKFFKAHVSELQQTTVSKQHIS